MHCFQHLPEIGPESVRSPLEGLLWKERNHVKPDCPRVIRRDDETGVCVGGFRNELNLAPGPVRADVLDHGGADRCAIIVFERRRQRSRKSTTGPCIKRERVSLALAHMDSIDVVLQRLLEPMIGDPDARGAAGRCDLQAETRRIFFVKRLRFVERQRARAVTACYERPTRRFLAVLERPVLEHLGVDTAVARAVDFFKEDSV